MKILKYYQLCSFTVENVLRKHGYATTWKNNLSKPSIDCHAPQRLQSHHLHVLVVAYVEFPSARAAQKAGFNLLGCRFVSLRL